MKSQAGGIARAARGDIRDGCRSTLYGVMVLCLLSRRDDSDAEEMIPIPWRALQVQAVILLVVLDRP